MAVDLFCSNEYGTFLGWSLLFGFYLKVGCWDAFEVLRLKRRSQGRNFIELQHFVEFEEMDLQLERHENGEQNGSFYIGQGNWPS